MGNSERNGRQALLKVWVSSNTEPNGKNNNHNKPGRVLTGNRNKPQTQNHTLQDTTTTKNKNTQNLQKNQKQTQHKKQNKDKGPRLPTLTTNPKKKINKTQNTNHNF